MRRPGLITRLCCGVLFVLSGAAYADDRGLIPELVGGIINLDTGDTSNLGGVSVAYNSTGDEYRVVWFDSRIVGQNDVYAQRLATDGTLLGANVTIIAGSASQTDTAVAHNPTTNEYLITWRNQSGPPGSPGFNHAFGGIASATGGLIGGESDLSNAGLEATLAYNSAENEYFLEARNFAGGGVAGIYGKRVSATLRAPGATGFDKAYGRRVWVHLERPEDVNEAYIQDLRRRRQLAETCVESYLARRGKEERTSL